MSREELVSADQVEKEAQIMLSMVENIRSGAIEASRSEQGELRYRITDKGRSIVEAMGKSGELPL
jgi:predicted transcriptional regulator